jgi:hypothetical protein
MAGLEARVEKRDELGSTVKGYAAIAKGYAAGCLHYLHDNIKPIAVVGGLSFGSLLLYGAATNELPSVTGALVGFGGINLLVDYINNVGYEVKKKGLEKGEQGHGVVKKGFDKGRDWLQSSIDYVVDTKKGLIKSIDTLSACGLLLIADYASGSSPLQYATSPDNMQQSYQLLLAAPVMASAAKASAIIGRQIITPIAGLAGRGITYFSKESNANIASSN